MDASSDDAASAGDNFVAIAGACVLVALVALVAVTRSRNNNTSGKPITEDADASTLNPLYSAPTGQFSHDDRGTAAAIAGQAPAEVTYDSVNSVNYAKAPQPGDVTYEYEARFGNATYAANDTYANNTYGLTRPNAEPRRTSTVLESGYTCVGTEDTSPEATYDLRASNNNAGTPGFAIGTDYAVATTADPTYDADVTYDLGAAAEEAPVDQDAIYGLGNGQVAAPVDRDTIYDNSPTRSSDDAQISAPVDQDMVYGLGNGQIAATANTCQDVIYNNEVANIDAVY